MNSFKQTTSFTSRLRKLIIIISLFFIVGFIASYLSSMSFLNGLRQMEKSNQVFNLSAQVNESLNSAQQYSENILTDKHLDNTRYAFHRSVDLAKFQLMDAITYTGDHPVMRGHLADSLIAVGNYEDVVKNLIQNLRYQKDKPIDPESLKSELIVAQQYVLEAKENIRKTQIILKNESDISFQNIFKNRFRPLYVAIVLTILFFSFVIIAGFQLAKKLSLSVTNLNQATEAVSRGDLNYQAPIREEDEIGKLTHEFNIMVSRLNYTMNHIKRLQDITGTFSEALNSNQVFDTIVQQGKDAMGAQAGSIGILNEDGSKIEMKKMVGYEENIIKNFSTISIDLDTPMTRVIKKKIEIFIETEKDLASNYLDMPKTKLKSFVVLPLMVNGDVLGVLSFSFRYERVFAKEEREFVTALARQCAQAIHRVKLFEDAKTAIKARDEFLSIASHELKTPLTPLKLQLQVLARRVQQGNPNELTHDKLLQMVDKSNMQITRLTTLIEDLLDVSRITTGKMTLNYERFELSEMIDEIVDQYRQQLRIASTEIEVEAAPGIFAVLDRVRIEQVIINILTNAGKYAPGKPVKIKLTSEGTFARIAVQDQGPGIDKIHQKRVFERFERVSDRNNIGGLGLGLYISKQIIDAHGGRIFVQSIKGDGSTFIVEIPLVPDNYGLGLNQEKNIQ